MFERIQPVCGVRTYVPPRCLLRRTPSVQWSGDDGVRAGSALRSLRGVCYVRFCCVVPTRDSPRPARLLNFLPLPSECARRSHSPNAASRVLTTCMQRRHATLRLGLLMRSRRSPGSLCASARAQMLLHDASWVFTTRRCLCVFTCWSLICLRRVQMKSSVACNKLANYGALRSASVT